MPNIEYIIITIIVLALLLPYLLLRFASRAMIGKPAPSLDDIVTEATDLKRPVYLYFMTRRCGSCKAMTPLIEEEGERNPNVIVIDIGERPELGMRFGIRGTPTILAIRDGVIEKVRLGSMKGRKLAEFLGGQG